MLAAAPHIVTWFTFFMLLAVLAAGWTAITEKSLLAAAVGFMALAFLLDAVL